MKIKGDYAIIERVEEEAVFPAYSLVPEALINNKGTSRKQVLAAITPKEGDAVFWWNTHDGERYEPIYELLYGGEYHGEATVKANALTIGKTVGELRKLLAWAKGES